MRQSNETWISSESIERSKGSMRIGLPSADLEMLACRCLAACRAEALPRAAVALTRSTLKDRTTVRGASFRLSKANSSPLRWSLSGCWVFSLISIACLLCGVESDAAPHSTVSGVPSGYSSSSGAGVCPHSRASRESLSGVLYRTLDYCTVSITAHSSDTPHHRPPRGGK